MKDRFAAYHPVINFTFFIGAIVSGMMLIHPVFMACSLLLSFLYYLTVRGKAGFGFVSGMCTVFLVLSLMNPLFNTQGAHVLFRYFRNRPYTMEALFYGMTLAAMMAAMLSWFASYHAVMTSDKFMYLFGHMAPAVTLVLTMVLRLVPSYKNKVQQMNGARRCIGKGADVGTAKEKTEHGMVLLSTLTSWALEGGVITADSMRSRGYGCGKRTHFSLYRFEDRDRLLLVVMVILLGIVAVCCLNGASAATYIPEIRLQSPDDPWMLTGVLAYAVFLSIPSAVNIWEELRWRSLKSKI